MCSGPFQCGGDYHYFRLLVVAGLACHACRERCLYMYIYKCACTCTCTCTYGVAPGAVLTCVMHECAQDLPSPPGPGAAPMVPLPGQRFWHGPDADTDAEVAPVFSSSSVSSFISLFLSFSLPLFSFFTFLLLLLLHLLLHSCFFFFLLSSASPSCFLLDLLPLSFSHTYKHTHTHNPKI
jgi:hypothetical protein